MEIGWILLTSANLSQAAWGVLQRKGQILFIKSYEIGVIFVPSRSQRKHRRFSCTPSHFLLGECEDRYGISNQTLRFYANQRNRTSTSSAQRDSVFVPIPFRIPPNKYSENDNPWVWDRSYDLLDFHGNTFHT